jgi:glycosyltransferase involved in cell wall biosynthesis
MLIWLVKIGETLPIGESDNRLLRTGLIGNAFVEKGHDIVWWSSTFDHFKKKQIFHVDTNLQLKPNYRLILLHGKGYHKNVSLARIKDHRLISTKFRKRIYDEKIKPDIIVCAYPIVELAYHCIQFGKDFNIPVIIDIRDLWPDIFFEELLPKFTRKFALNLYNLFIKKHQFVFKNATAIIGITDKILNWGLEYAGRKSRDIDKVFHLSYSKPLLQHTTQTVMSLSQKGLAFKENVLYVCLIGTISKYKFDLNLIVSAAKVLQKSTAGVEFVICGDGEGLEWFKNETLGLTNIHFTGWINQNEIAYILDNVQIGLAPYFNTFTYVTSIPSKISEYFAYGLPVLSGLKGELGNFITQNNAGYVYSSGKQMAEILVNLDSNKEVLDQFKENNLILYSQKFDSRIVYENYINYILSYQSSNEL